jgi:aminopeptidase N
MFGKEAAYKYLGGYFNNPANQEPIIGDLEVNGEGSGDMYPKGAAMLHTLRNVVNNDNLWFETIKAVAQNFKHKTTNTKEIVNFMNKKLKKDYTYFFDQYLRYPNIPILQYRKNNKNKKIECRWVTDVKNFKMPILIKDITGKFEWITPTNEWKNIEISIKDDELEIFPLSFYVDVEKN